MRQPLPLERAFLQNFLSLASMPIDSDDAVRVMDADGQLRHRRGLSDARRQRPEHAPKRYRAGVEPEVDAAIARLGVDARERSLVAGGGERALPCRRSISWQGSPSAMRCR